MLEKKCSELLGVKREESPDIEVTIESLSDAIIKSIDSKLTDTTHRIEDFKGCVLGSHFLFLKSGNELLLLVVDDDGDLCVSEDGDFLFRLLSAEGRLREVADDAVVTSLERLRAQEVTDCLAKKEEKERAEWERLSLKFGK